MAEPATRLVPLRTLEPRALHASVRELLDAAVGVARRLDQNVIGIEHMLVVGAENGLPEMQRRVPSLAAFREALLDALFDDRLAFRRHEGKDADDVFLRPELLAALQRVKSADQARRVLASLMTDGPPRAKRAFEHARDAGPEVLPPDTIVLEATREERSATHAGDEPLASTGSATEEEAPPDPAGTPLTRELSAAAREEPPLVGRDGLLEQVARVLVRFQQPAVVITGPPGSGKTAFVRGLAGAAARGSLPALAGFRFHQLVLLDLVSLGHRGQDLHQVLDQLVTGIGREPKGVLVIDDLHMLLAKQGAPLLSDVIDTLRFHLHRGHVRALLTVDTEAWSRSFSADAFFGGEISVRSLPPLARTELLVVAELRRGALERHYGLPIAPDALQAAVDLSLSVEQPEYHPPGATVRLLDEGCAMARARRAERVLAEHVGAAHAEGGPGRGSLSRDRLGGLQAALEATVLGQEQAAATLARRVRLAKLRLDRKPERPDGVFLFIGPSGVGKTEMARSLCRALYGDEARLVRIDMSEYMEPHSVARIIGAPPGYVGYGEEGALTGPVSRLGHAVVLLDEIEKAHPQVLNLFLQVFDDGRLTDSRGRVVSFSDCVVIMTSNIGRELYALGANTAIGLRRREPAPSRPVDALVQDHLLRVLPPEFVNRIDELVAFRVLDDADVLRIARRMLEAEAGRWKARGKELVFTQAVVDHIARTGYDPRLGARHVERNVERLVIVLLSDASVSPFFERATKLELAVKDGTVCLALDGQPFACNPRGMG